MPFDGQPDDFGNGGGGGAGPHPDPYAVKLGFSMMVGSLLSASGYAIQEHWAVDTDVGTILIAEGPHDGFSIPAEVIQASASAAREVMQRITGRICHITFGASRPSNTIN